MWRITGVPLGSVRAPAHFARDTRGFASAAPYVVQFQLVHQLCELSKIVTESDFDAPVEDLIYLLARPGIHGDRNQPLPSSRRSLHLSVSGSGSASRARSEPRRLCPFIFCYRSLGERLIATRAQV